MRLIRIINLVIIPTSLWLGSGFYSTSVLGNTSPGNITQPSSCKVKMSSNLTHLPVRLSLPYYPWAEAYKIVRADSDMGPYLDQQMIPALERAGDPAQRLTNMANAATQARLAFAETRREPDFTFAALDPVEVDLQLAFIVALSKKIAEAPQVSVEEKITALRELLTIVKADYPVGIPEPSDFAPWTATARITAEAEIKVIINNVRKAESNGKTTTLDNRPK
ncbi:MAG TPA: hypothetical protein VK184_26595 [Nostocaceae cyanobacterium]|nr:hypothetical protein [Nostocaceae cyanobacterium]